MPNDTEMIISIGDIHHNSTVALCPSGAELDDGGTYSLSKGQWWLLRQFNDFCEKLIELKKKYKPKRIITFWGGDLIDLDAKNRSWQYITRNPTSALDSFFTLVNPIIEITDINIVLKGTPAHSGKSSWLETEIGRELNAVPDESTGKSAWWYFKGEFGGVKFDATHTAPMGRLPWTQGNSLNRLAIELQLEYMGERLPDLALRWHNHRKYDTYDNYLIRLISCPSWCLKQDYLWKDSKPNGSDIGSNVIICQNGVYECIKMNYSIPRMPTWKPEKVTSQKQTFGKSLTGIFKGKT